MRSSLPSTAIVGAPEALRAPPGIFPPVELRVLGYFDRLTLILDTLVPSFALPTTPPVFEVRVFRDLKLLASIADVFEATLALPRVSVVAEECVFGQLDLITPIVDVFETTPALPRVSAVAEKGVFGDPNLYTLVVVAPEASVALPPVSEADVGMVRDGRGVSCAQETVGSKPSPVASRRAVRVRDLLESRCCMSPLERDAAIGRSLIWG